MKKLATLLATLAMAGIAHASLKPGDSLTPYEIKNVESGKVYCQVCAYGAKAGKIVAFGKLKDEAFWTDLQKLQKLQDGRSNLGVFAQVIDSHDAKAIRATAEKYGIKFPVVVAKEKTWDKAYKVEGVSRTIYYAQQNNKIVWTGVGLDDTAAVQLEERVKKDLAS
jgi:hypothetical protein